MNKTHTTLSIDPEILEKAKQDGINLSEALEEALTKKETEKKINDYCNYCGFGPMRHATADDLN
jgi:post-segregation antitoxin (ccd killing protein)